MKVKLNKILKEKNKTKYWLAKQTGITPQNIGLIASDKTSSIKFDTLEKICNVLECTPNDLFEIEKYDNQ